MIDTPNFLTPEESAQVDQALLSQSDKFLTRLSISSLRLLTLIAQDRQMAIADLTPDQIIAWFEAQAKLKLEQGESAPTLKW